MRVQGPPRQSSLTASHARARLVGPDRLQGRARRRGVAAAGVTGGVRAYSPAGMSHGGHAAPASKGRGVLRSCPRMLGAFPWRGAPAQPHPPCGPSPRGASCRGSRHLGCVATGGAMGSAGGDRRVGALAAPFPGGNLMKRPSHPCSSVPGPWLSVWGLDGREGAVVAGRGCRGEFPSAGKAAGNGCRLIGG